MSGPYIDAGSIKPCVYTLAELRNGTGFARGVQFVMLTPQVEARLVAHDALVSALKGLLDRIMDENGADFLPVNDEFDRANYDAVQQARAALDAKRGKE